MKYQQIIDPVFPTKGEGIILQGAFIVVGVIGTGQENIYLLQDASHKVSKIKIPYKSYNIGQKICV